jgi:hypothetical protein
MNLYFGNGNDRPVRIPTDVRDYLREEIKHQYRDGFSMAEAAKSWVNGKGNLPPRIAEVVGSTELVSAHFEYETQVWGGGTAMTDVMAFLPAGVIAVEAKRNEPFDDLVSSWIYKRANPEHANYKPASPPRRKAVIERYANDLGVSTDQLMGIRYQLLQRTLSASKTASTRGLSDCWMIVQSFASKDDDGYLTNRTDFDQYVALVGNAPVLDGIHVKLAWVSESRG